MSINTEIYFGLSSDVLCRLSRLGDDHQLTLFERIERVRLTSSPKINYYELSEMPPDDPDAFTLQSNENMQ